MKRRMYKRILAIILILCMLPLADVQVVGAKTVNAVRGVLPDFMSFMHGIGEILVDTEDEKVVVADSNGLTDLSITEDYTLTEDLEVANLSVNHARLRLNGHRLVVNGTTTLNNAGVVVDSGEWIAMKEVSVVNSYISMDDINSHVVIHGTLIWQSNVQNYLKKGILELKSNFIQQENCIFVSQDEHTILLSGTEKQEIAVQKGATNLNRIQISNTDEEGVVFHHTVLVDEWENEGSKVSFLEMDGIE